MSSHLHNRSYTEQEVRDLVPALDEDFGVHPLRDVPAEYTGTGAAQCGVAWYTGTMNAHMAQHRIDALFSLMDHHRIFVDAPLRVPAYAWFPDHYVQLDHHTRHILPAYAGALALSPSSTRKVQEAVPYKRAEWVPHIIERDAAVRSRSVVRDELKIPADTFVAFVTFANYGGDEVGGQRWRKGFDTSLVAFRALLAAAPSALLLLHSVRTSKVFDHAATAASSGGSDLRALIARAKIPARSVRLHEERVPYARVLELIASSDVLLHPSRTEGFGMAVLEAQLYGVPVLTTKFGAMADFTLYGVAVEPAGIERTPSGDVPKLDDAGVTAALLAVHAGRVPGDRAQAISRIEERMSTDAVVSIFEKLLRAPPKRPRVAQVARLTRTQLAAAAGHADADGTGGGALARLTEDRPWALLVPEACTLTVDEDALDVTVQFHANTSAHAERAARAEVSALGRLDALGEAQPTTKAVPAVEATFLLAHETDGSTRPPTAHSPILMSSARLRGLLDAGGVRALDAELNELARAVASHDFARANFLIGAVPKPEGGC